MLNKKTVKIISIILIAVLMLMAFGNVAFALAEGFTPDTGVIEGTQAKTLANTILGALKWAGVAIAIGMMIFLGIKYVTSSPEGKANLKGQLGIYILGLVFILAATMIVQILENAIPA